MIPTHASYSKFKRLKISPAHVLIEQEKTQAMKLGSAFHSFVLQPEKFEKEYMIFDDSAKVAEIGGGNPRATTKYKEWLQTLPMDKERLSLSETAHFEPLKERIANDPFFKYITKGAIIEEKLKFSYPIAENETIAMVSIPDIVNVEKKVVIDLKTCQSAKVESFKKDAANLDYHLQAAIYIEACKQVYGDGDWTFMFLAAETNAPYLIQWLSCDEQFVNVGKYEADILAMLWTDCCVNGFNRGYEVFCQDKRKIETLSLPNWKLSQTVDFYQQETCKSVESKQE
jgi:hypothetical protein